MAALKASAVALGPEESASEYLPNASRGMRPAAYGRTRASAGQWLP
jgi:hypothetical protein